jgi:uncharacterized protein with NRDE domain
MCLILVAFKTVPDYPLLIAANRDEFHARPAQKADWWPDDANMLGGRDLQAGGTWLAVHRSGKFAAVTNYRDADASKRSKRSRGHLVSEFLQGTHGPREYIQTLKGEDFAGFNLLLSDGQTLAYLSNRGAQSGELPPGLYGLSNATLDTPWEKVERSRGRLQALIDNGTVNESSLLRVLADQQKGPVDEVDSSRLPFATAHAITAPFIVLPEYGTRCSTVVLADQHGKWSLTERRFAADGSKSGESRYSFHSIHSKV